MQIAQQLMKSSSGEVPDKPLPNGEVKEARKGSDFFAEHMTGDEDGETVDKPAAEVADPKKPERGARAISFLLSPKGGPEVEMTKSARTSFDETKVAGRTKEGADTVRFPSTSLEQEGISTESVMSRRNNSKCQHPPVIVPGSTARPEKGLDQSAQLKPAGQGATTVASVEAGKARASTFGAQSALGSVEELTPVAENLSTSRKSSGSDGSQRAQPSAVEKITLHAPDHVKAANGVPNEMSKVRTRAPAGHQGASSEPLHAVPANAAPPKTAMPTLPVRPAADITQATSKGRARTSVASGHASASMVVRAEATGTLTTTTMDAAANSVLPQMPIDASAGEIVGRLIEGSLFVASSETHEFGRSVEPGSGRVPDLAAKPVIAQIIQAAKTVMDGVMELRLSPEELGRVRLSMSTTEFGMTVNVTTERPETLVLLRRNIDMLAADLTEQGFSDLNFSFGQEGRREFSEHDAYQQDDHTGPNAQTAKLSDQRLRNNALSDGRLDIRL